jgi:hypothetical protein
MCLLNPQSHPFSPVGDSLGTRRRHHLDKYSTCKLALAMQEHPYINSRITIIATITTVNFLHPTQWKFHCPSESGLSPTHTTIQSENSMDLTFLASIHRSHSALDGTFGTHNPAHKREKHNWLQSFVHIVITCWALCEHPHKFSWHFGPLFQPPLLPHEAIFNF